MPRASVTLQLPLYLLKVLPAKVKGVSLAAIGERQGIRRADVPVL